MSTHLKSMLLIICGASLMIGSSFAIPSLQEGPPNKLSAAHKTQVRQQEGHPAPEVIVYWDKLRARGEGPLGVSWNVRTGTPQSIFGKVPAAIGGSSELAARSFFAENAPLFKMKQKEDDLVLVCSHKSLLGEHFIFEQDYQGVPVYGAQVGIHFNRAGEIVVVNNTYQPEIALASVEPQVNQANAIGRALATLKSGSASEAGSELFVYNFNDSFSLAWRIVVPTDGPTWEMFVDAQDGRLLGEPRDINRYVNGVGQVYNVNAVVATQDNSLRDNADSAAAVPATAYRIVTLQGLFGNGRLDGDFASSSKSKKRASDAGNIFIFDRSTDEFSETMGYYYIDYAERYIQSLGFTNVNNRQQVFAVNRYKYDNSFYSLGNKEITYGLGGVDDAEDAEVILHEYGHSIQDNQVPGFGASVESGAMGEGFGDYWGASIGAQFSGGFQDLCLAEWDATSYSSSNPPCLRRLDGSKHYPEDLAGEVHDDGEIWSAALWQIRDGVGATNADRVILAAHFLLAPNASFNQGANALVTSAKSLGLGNRQVNLIRNILSDRGFNVTV